MIDVIKKKFFNTLIKVLCVSLCFSHAYAQNTDIAIISMHGKWGAPPGPLATYLENEGFYVESPIMPWSRFRNYDITYEKGLEEIHVRVHAIKAKGYKKVILAGHSFGGNGALAYASRYSDIDGLILYAAGHVPELFYQYQRSTRDVDRAREILKAGKGSEMVSFTDPNSGNRSKTLNTSAEIYLSYFDPESLANMPLSASRIEKALPVLCIVSTEDGISRWGPDYIFNKLKPHALSVYITTSASHLMAPEENRSATLDFLRKLQSP